MTRLRNSRPAAEHLRQMLCTLSAKHQEVSMYEWIKKCLFASVCFVSLAQRTWYVLGPVSFIGSQGADPSFLVRSSAVLFVVYGKSLQCLLLTYNSVTELLSFPSFSSFSPTKGFQPKKTQFMSCLELTLHCLKIKMPFSSSPLSIWKLLDGLSGSCSDI